ncbi:hypothetical protein D3C72_59240 [compost metagenome]
MRNANQFLDRNPFSYLNQQDLSVVPISGVQDLLTNPLIRQKIAKKRWEAFSGQGHFINSDNTVDDMLSPTYEHNMNMLAQSLDSLPLLERPSLLIRPLVSIDKVSFNQASVKVLTVGPRTEYEILMLLGYGFPLDNITGLDLFSYSPWIDAGDMHASPYEDNSFDVIILGWVFAYSSNMQKLADEILRVAKPGAVIAIGQDYYPPSYEFEPRFKDRVRFDRVQQLLDFFSGHVKKVFFQNEPDPSLAHLQGNLMVIFDIAKPEAASLATGKGTNLLACPDWSQGSGSLEVTVSSYLTAFDSADDVCLVLWLSEESGEILDAATEKVAALIRRAGFTVENTPDIMIVPGNPGALASVISQVHGFLPCGSETEGKILGQVNLASLPVFELESLSRARKQA